VLAFPSTAMIGAAAIAKDPPTDIYVSNDIEAVPNFNMDIVIDGRIGNRCFREEKTEFFAYPGLTPYKHRT
jgi:hypothetical protein